MPSYTDPTPTYRPPIPPKEKCLVAVGVVTLLFTGWAFGGMRLWTQWVLLGLGTFTLIVALLPWGNGFARESRSPLGRLLRFPLFWLGGCFLLYCLIQQWNPEWIYRREGSRWWLEPQDPITWLPAGIVAPMEYFSGSRTLLWMGGAFLSLCGLWVGLQSRRSTIFLLWTWVLNSTVIAFVGIAFSLLGSRTMLGQFDPGRARQFFANFYYANHAGAFLLLGLVITLGLSLHTWVQAQRRGDKSNPGFFLVLLALIQLAGIFFTTSRGSILLSLLAVAVFAVAGLFALYVYANVNRLTLWILGICIPIFLATAALFFARVDFERIEKEMQSAFVDITSNAFAPDPLEPARFDKSLEFRRLMARATLDMWEEKPWTGHGLGGYRHYIVVHQKNYEPIWIHPATYRKRLNPEGRILKYRVTYAHSDWLQFLAEVGVLGGALLIAVLGGWAWLFFQKFSSWSPATWVWLSGVGILVLYGAFEFVFWCPSVFWMFGWVPLLAYKTLR